VRIQLRKKIVNAIREKSSKKKRGVTFTSP